MMPSRSCWNSLRKSTSAGQASSANCILDLRRIMFTCRTTPNPNCFVIKQAADSHDWGPMMTSMSRVVWAGRMLTL